MGMAENRQKFEESLPSRDIKRYKSHVFVHTIALEATGRANTGMNNEILDTQNMSPAESIRRVLGGNISLSCSAIPKKTDPPRPERSFVLETNGEKSVFGMNRRAKEDAKTMYPFGLILEEGLILAAYRNDAGTLIEKGRHHRRSKYDKRTKDSAIQENIRESIDHALEPATRFMGHEDHGAQQMGRDLNELVVSHTKAGHLFLNLDDPSCSAGEAKESYHYGRKVKALIAEVEALATEFPHLPMMIQHEGEIKECTRGAGELILSGEPLTNVVARKLEAERQFVTRVMGGGWEAVEAHMWASGDMPAETEGKYLSENLKETHLLARDAEGDTALHTAARTGRNRHIPKGILEKYGEIEGAEGQKLKDLLNHRGPAETIDGEAALRMTKVAPFKTGPIKILGLEKKEVWAVGNTPSGGVLCTDEKGSSFGCGLDWHLSGGTLKQMFAEYLKAGDSKRCQELESLAENAAVRDRFFNMEWIRETTLAKEMEAFSRTKSPETDPALPGKTAAVLMSGIPAPSPTLTAAQNAGKNRPSWKESLTAIREATKKIVGSLTRNLEGERLVSR